MVHFSSGCGRIRECCELTAAISARILLGSATGSRKEAKLSGGSKNVHQDLRQQIDDQQSIEKHNSIGEDRQENVVFFPIPLAWTVLLGLLCCFASVRLALRWTAQAIESSSTKLEHLPAFVVNLNTASVEELQALPEVGPALAQRIVEYRQTVGKIGAIDELQNVHGFGPKRLENLAEMLTVQNDTASASSTSRQTTPIDGKLNAN